MTAPAFFSLLYCQNGGITGKVLEFEFYIKTTHEYLS